VSGAQTPFLSLPSSGQLPISSRHCSASHHAALPAYHCRRCCRALPPLSTDCCLCRCRDFTGNNITGELPDSWAVPGTFPALRTLSISAAQLNGSLPAAWGSPGAFPALGELRLNGNRLRGSLPTSWGARGAFPALKEL
jgi:hypothetical protein